ncbi:MAG: SIR2 family protein [Thermodesulfovibrionales bacterium]|nr:SIR2 family protein [Thermodesulfovibrionales bacterium]
MEKINKAFRNLELKEATPEIGELIDRISSGMAILFAGAGFSVGTKNIQNQEPPIAKQLSKAIARLGNFDEDEDLMFTSDYYLENCEVDPLIDFLKDQFTINHTETPHDIVCSMAWRRIYTTNYDNAIAFSAAKNGRLIESITIDQSPEDYLRKHNICVHINGNISSINRDSLRKSFKLSNSSYLSPESFTASPWYYPFKKDIERCSALVFVGYSLYDIDIQKVLFQSPELKSKTYFIVKKDPSKKELFTLSKYGVVCPIGVEEFSKALEKKSEAKKQVKEELWTEAFVEYKLKDTDIEMTDKAISDFLMHGNIDDA